jgi:hypothetical protein
MPVVTYSDFSIGKDLRKGASVSDANRLRELKNGYVTTGKAIRKRGGTEHIKTLETGTKGLFASGGVLNTFTSDGSVVHSNVIRDPKYRPIGSNALDDLVSSGTFNGTDKTKFVLEIDSTGSPDTFKWQKEGGILTSGVNITGSAQVLIDGVSVTFGATTGHTLEDKWEVECLVFTPKQVAGSNVNPTSFTGSGVNDATSSGSYVGTGNPTFTIEIDGSVTGAITKMERENTGPITAMASSGGGSATEITSNSHGLSNGNSVIITGTTSYDGTFTISGVTTNTFIISDTFVANDATGQWELNPNPSASVTTITSNSHGLSNGDQITITGTTGYNGTFSVSGVTTNTFVISVVFSNNDATGNFEKIPNTFKWKKGSGAYTTGVAITTTLQTLQEGVQVTFGAKIGHAMGDIWTIGISGSITVAHVHYADVFSDYIYTSVEYSNGTVLHHYLDGTIPSKISDTNCPNTKGVVKMENKIWATNGDAVRFSATGNPRDWTTTSDAGFLAVGLKQKGSDNALALGQYKERNLVVFFADGSQLWAVDPDPANHSFTQSLPGVHTRYHRSIALLFQDMYMLTDFGFRSISESVLTGSQAEIDIGSPIDSVIQRVLPQTPAVNPKATFNPALGQYICAIKKSIYAFTISKSAKITAWSDHQLPFEIDDWTILDSEVYIRSGDNVYRITEEVFQDAYETKKTISAYADGTGGFTTVTDTAHGRSNGDIVTISGTTNYNGTFTISSVATNTFKIEKAFVANDATGTYTAGTPYEFEMSMSFVDAKQPGVLKMWRGVDLVTTGTARLTFKYLDGDGNVFTTDEISLSGDTRPDTMTSVELTGVNIAPVVKNNSNEEFQLDAISLYFETLAPL